MALPSRPEGVFLAGMLVRVTLSNPGGGRRRAGLNGRAQAAKGNLSLVVLGGRSWLLAVLVHHPQRRPQQVPASSTEPPCSREPPLSTPPPPPTAGVARWLNRHVGHGAQVSGVTLVGGGCVPAYPAAGARQANRPLEDDRCVSLSHTSHSRNAVLRPLPHILVLSVTSCPATWRECKPLSP